MTDLARANHMMIDEVVIEIGIETGRDLPLVKSGVDMVIGADLDATK